MLSNNTIIQAVREGNAHILDQLASLPKEEAHTLVNKPESNNDTALHAAVDKGDLSAVELLLQYGANPNASGLFNETPLHHAAAGNFSAIAKSLLAAGASCDVSRTDSMKPIHVAASNDAADVINILVNHDPNQLKKFRLILRVVHLQLAVAVHKFLSRLH